MDDIRANRVSSRPAAGNASWRLRTNPDGWFMPGFSRVAGSVKLKNSLGEEPEINGGCHGEICGIVWMHVRSHDERGRSVPRCAYYGLPDKSIHRAPYLRKVMQRQWSAIHAALKSPTGTLARYTASETCTFVNTARLKGTDPDFLGVMSPRECAVPGQRSRRHS
jgi:hypothetical protein